MSRTSHGRRAQGDVEQGLGGRPSGLRGSNQERRRQRWCRMPTNHRWRSSRSPRTSSSVSTAPSTRPSIGRPSRVSIGRARRWTGSIRRPDPSGISSSGVSGVIPSDTRSAFGMTSRPSRSTVTVMATDYHPIGKMVPARRYATRQQGPLVVRTCPSAARSLCVSERRRHPGTRAPRPPRVQRLRPSAAA